MAQAADYAARMVAALAVSEPTLDTGIGSVTRKILDAVSEVAAQVTADQHLLNYSFDVNSKIGSDLDDFLLMFGFIRFPAQRAIGVCTFGRTVAATQDFLIPQGTTVITGNSPVITYQTTAPAYLPAGATSIDAPIQCVLAGSAGNLPIKSITALSSAVNGIEATPTNLTPITGGAAAEDDTAFRERWKRTVFRSLAGTSDMFAATALDATDPTTGAATAVNVIGASSRWREQVQISGQAATSTILPANIKYVFPNSSVCGTNIDGGLIFTPGVHYSFNALANPPTISVLSNSIPDGTFVDLDFEYCSAASRNDPANGLTSRVDVWVGGFRSLQATETSYFRTSTPFTSTPGPYQNTTYVRLDTNNVAPTVGNFFTPLAFGPITAFPNTLNIAGTTYTEGVDYWVVHDRTAFGYGPTSSFGLEWLASRALPNLTAIILSGVNTYTYNALPSDVENRATNQRLVTTDLRAHAAKPIYLRFTMAIMADYGADRATVAADLKSDLAGWVDTKGFGKSLQVSDLLHEAHSVRGVDNIRLLTQSEPNPATNTYGIEHVTSAGTFISQYVGGAGGRSTDIFFADNEVPVLEDVVLVFRAANSFGVS